jgi:hypothetical protein
VFESAYGLALRYQPLARQPRLPRVVFQVANSGMGKSPLLTAMTRYDPSSAAASAAESRSLRRNQVEHVVAVSETRRSFTRVPVQTGLTRP